MPIRNAIFITIATAWAFSVDADLIVFGAHTDDFHYPDCRPKFIQSITNTLNIGEEDKSKMELKKRYPYGRHLWKA